MPGGPEIQPGIARPRALVLAPYEREIRIVKASATDIIVLRRFDDNYVLARFGDTLNRIWTRTFEADDARDIEIAMLVSHDTTVTAVMARLCRDADSMEYYAVTCDARTGEVRRTRTIAHYKQTGSKLDPEYCTAASTADTSACLLYRTDLHQLKHHASLTLDAWEFPVDCDTILERHIPITITEEEKDNESPIIARLALDGNARLIQLQCRADSTLLAIRTDLRSNIADTLIATASGFDFKDDDNLFDEPTLLFDSAGRLHIAGARQEPRPFTQDASYVGTTNMLTAIVLDFDAKTVTPVVKCVITPDVAARMSRFDELGPYELQDVKLLPKGGYLFVLEHQYYFKPSTGTPFFWGERYMIKAHWNRGDYAMIAFDEHGKTMWQSMFSKHGPGSVQLIASPPRLVNDSTAPPGSQLWVSGPDGNGSIMWMALQTSSGKPLGSGILYSVNSANGGEPVAAAWISDRELVQVTMRDRDLSPDVRRQMDTADGVENGTVGSSVQAIVKMVISP